MGKPKILTDLQNVITEITNARKGKSDLKTKIDEIDASYPLNSIYRQALINGNFDVWQRGIGWTNPLSSTFFADRWGLGRNESTYTKPATITVGKGSNAIFNNGANNYLYVTTDGAGSGTVSSTDTWEVFQRIENGTKCLCGVGKKVTISFWAISNIANKKLAIELSQRYGTGGSPSANETISAQVVTLNSGWQKYTLTFTTNTLVGKTFGTNNDDYLQIKFRYIFDSSVNGTQETFGGAGTTSLSQVQLNVGDVALPFMPKSFAQELQDCMRYYEKSYPYNVTPGTASAYTDYTAFQSKTTTPNGAIIAQANFKVKKRVAGTGAVYDIVNGNVNRIGNFSPYADSSFVVQAHENSLRVINSSGGNVTTTDTLACFHWAVDAEL